MGRVLTCGSLSPTRSVFPFPVSVFPGDVVSLGEVTMVMLTTVPVAVRRSVGVSASGAGFLRRDKSSLRNQF